MSVHLSTYLSMYLSIHLPTYLSTNLLLYPPTELHAAALFKKLKSPSANQEIPCPFWNLKAITYPHILDIPQTYLRLAEHTICFLG